MPSQAPVRLSGRSHSTVRRRAWHDAVTESRHSGSARAARGLAMLSRCSALVVASWASMISCAETHSSTRASSGSIAPTIEFSDDESTVAISYGDRTWTLQRPATPRIEMPGGEVYWVSTDGDDQFKGTTTSPFRTIRKSLSVAKAGDVVFLNPGTYREIVRIEKSGAPGKPLVLSSAPGALGKVKVVAPDGFARANEHNAIVEISKGAQYVWINGLVIEGVRGKEGAPTNEDYGANGITWSGGAGYGCRATSNVVYGNLHCGLKEMNHGGHSIVIEGNIVFENGTDRLDHGIYVPSSDMKLFGNIIFNNSGWGIHSYENPQRHLMLRNLLFGNGSGGILLAGSHNELYHNVSVRNGRGLLYFRGGSAFNVVKNNIFAFNEGAESGVDTGGGQLGAPHDNVEDFNCYYPERPDPRISAGKHELYADPLFADIERGEFRLMESSPCIDRGDFIGLAYEGSAPDIGYLESKTP